ncbi:MAG: T9SS type A sorting domain-containing protein [Bacteroides sp.]|nr:T9SS type A sorting domain-containing protein [Bacteroides sp.]
MKKISFGLIVLIGNIISPLNVLGFENAEERDCVPMIREDRVWEYTLLYDSDHSTREVCLFQMKFEGEEEHNGRVYSKCVFVGDEIRWSVDLSNEYASYNGDMVIKPTEKTEYFLLREEGGKVYLYLDSHLADIKKALADQSGLDTDEITVYDFNLAEREETDLISIRYEFENSYVIPSVGIYGHEVSSIETITVDGQECRKLSFGDTAHEVYFIEGIGTTTDGILPLYNIDDYITGYRHGEHYYNLNKVCNSAGEVIYRAEDYSYIDINTVSVETIGDESFEIREGEIVASSQGREVNVTVYDMSGRIEISASCDDKVQLPLAGLSPGVYIAEFLSGPTHKRIKFSK